MKWTLSCCTWRIMVQVVKHTNSKKTRSQLCGNHSSFVLKVFTNSSRNLTLNLKNSVVTHIVIPMYFGICGSLSKGCRDFLEEDVCFLKKLQYLKRMDRETVRITCESLESWSLRSASFNSIDTSLESWWHWSFLAASGWRSLGALSWEP